MPSNNHPKRFSKEVYEILKAAGWSQGRDVLAILPLPMDFDAFPAALVVIKEFGGLHIGECGPGIDRATSDVNFNPMLAAGLQRDLQQLENALDRKLYPVGEVHRGHGFVVLDDGGRAYLWSDELEPFAPSFERALELLLLGKEPSVEELRGAGMLV